MTTWTREMAVELAREEYERGLAEGRAEAAAEIARLRRERSAIRRLMVSYAEPGRRRGVLGGNVPVDELYRMMAVHEEAAGHD